MSSNQKHWSVDSDHYLIMLIVCISYCHTGPNCQLCFFYNITLLPDDKILDIPLADNKILDWSKLKQIADSILKCI